MVGPLGQEDIVQTWLGDHIYKDATIKISRGDYSGILKNMVECLIEAEVGLAI